MRTLRRMKIITDSRCTAYHQYGHPEGPRRISRTNDWLRQQQAVALTWGEPKEPQEAQILRAHSSRHLARLGLPMDFDGDTPMHPGIKEHALRSVGGALQAMECALKGETAFSLMRPPGHHATPNRAMGFCYLNNVAIAVLEALAQKAGKVAVYDFDVHHGNGTEEILLGKENCHFVSIHQYPLFPGTGTESRQNARNHPLPPGTPRDEYRAALVEGLEEIKRFAPALVAVSAGFDAYHGDPLSSASLELEDFLWLGQSLRALGVPVFSVLEGGYSTDLPELVLAYLKGLVGV
jgi:acetoin utilization deacetylase AcuC-like enzyme